MTPAEQTKALKDLLDRLRDRYGAPAGPDPDAPADPRAHEHGDPLIDELIRSMLQWEASAQQASAAYAKVLDAVSDYNELRICFPTEIEALFGKRYPKAAERAARLHACLNDIFSQEQALSLEHLRDAPKREAAAQIATFEGATPFTTARLVLLGLGGHALPLDTRLLKLLETAGVIEEGLDPAAATSKLERALRAGEAREAYELLEAWDADGAPEDVAPKRKAPSKSSSTKTTKKTTRKPTKKAAKKTTKKATAKSKPEAEG